MIRLTDATRLAATKLRTRKVRLVVTIVIAGLLFSVLAAASQVGRGVFASMASFNQEGFGDRFIVSSYLQSSTQDYASNPEIIDRALAIQKEIVAKKTAEAKRLGIQYDPKSERPPVDEFDGPDGKKMRSVSMEHPAGQRAIAEYSKAHPQPGKADLQRLAASYNVKAFYESKSLSQGPDQAQLKLIKDGKESFSLTRQQQNPMQAGLDSFTSAWGLMSSDLMQPFMLPGASATIGKDGSIPVIAPYSAVEQLQGLKALPSTAPPDERLERIKQVRAGADRITFQVCYRNQESNDLIGMALTQQQEIERNKNDKTYVKPTMQYGLPVKPCEVAPVIRDVRTAAEKKLNDKQEQFERLFGKKAPQQSLMTFRIIGIAPDPPNFNASVISTLVSSLVSSNLGFGMATWYTPVELEQTHPLLTTLFSDADGMAAASNFHGGSGGDYIEFNDAASAKAFITEQSCEPEFSVGTGPPDPSFNPFAACATQGKHFGFVPFGSNALALEDAKYWFNKIFGYVAMGVAAIAGIIMIGTVGRIIADSRRETAVFRAIGAKKLDIAITYLIYTLFLSLLIFSFALALGFGIAQLVDSKYAPEFTVHSLVAFNAQDLTKTFNLYNFYLPDIAKLLGLSLAGGFLSALFPLLRNLRRNPIRDMRDDT